MKSRVLVAGASGLIGVAAVEAFLDAGWQVVGISRRKPMLPSGRKSMSVSADLRDPKAVRTALSTITGVTHVVYAALMENPTDLVRGWSDQEQIETNDAMLRNLMDALVAANLPLKHVTIMQGTKAYGGHVRPLPIPARESDPRFDHPNFFLDQEDFVRDLGAKHGFTYTAWRPQLVTGKIPGALNVLPTIGVYASILREKGMKFGFPGGPSFVWEMVDADLLGKAVVWGAETPKAANEAFNITNGDVFEWRNLWSVLADTLGIEVGPDEPTNVTAFIRDNASVWKKIVDTFGLKTGDLPAFLGQGDQHTDFSMLYGAPAAPAIFVSTVKLRKAGFNAAVDTRDSLRNAFKWMIDQKLLPPATR